MILRIALALTVGIGLTLGGATAASQYEAQLAASFQQEQVGRVQDRAVARARDMEQALRETAMYLSERDVNLMSFEPRLMAVSDQNPTFRVVSWLPVVQKGGADRFLAEIRRSIPDFAFREVDPETGEIRGAGEALAYVPFLLLQPEHGNGMLRGVDLGNQKLLAEAMQRSYQIDGVSASAPTNAFPPDQEPSLLLLHYVQRPEGFVGGVVQADTLLDHLMEGAPTGLVGQLSDEGRGSVELAAQPGHPGSGDKSSVVLGGQRLSLTVAATPEYRPLGTVLVPAVLFGGVGITLVLLAMSLLGGGTAKQESR